MIERLTKPWKTVLFVPANKPKYLASAIKLKPDAVQLDLEDSVTADQKDQARALVKGACAQLRSNGIASIVRVNNQPEQLSKDLAASVSENLDAVTLPKLETIAQLEVLDSELSALEQQLDLNVGAISLLGLIETLTGLKNRESWVSAPKRLAGLALGSEDLCQQIGCEPTHENLIEPCRQVLYAAREAGLNAWGMPISIGEFSDIESLEHAIQYAKGMGMDGVWCVHPKQVETVQTIFKVSDDELAHAQRVVAAFEKARADGDGAVKVDGSMVDLPVYKRALGLLGRPTT